jgi:hypothetical protein
MTHLESKHSGIIDNCNLCEYKATRLNKLHMKEYNITVTSVIITQRTDVNRNYIKTSTGYAGVSLSLAKTELNAYGLHRTDGLRLNQFFLLLLLVGLK